MSEIMNIEGMRIAGFEMARDNGYELREIEVTKDGQLTVSIKNDDGEIIEACVSAEDAEIEAYKALNALNNFDKLSGIYRAWNIGRVATLAENAGFKSVGAFLNTQFPTLAVNTCNQMKAVADTFICSISAVDGEEDAYYPVWRYEWLKGANVSNVMLMMGIYNKFSDAIGDDYTADEIAEQFYNEYIKSGKLHLLKTQNKFKEELRALSGKASKASKADKADKASKTSKTDKEENSISNATEEAEEVTIAKAIAILEKYSLHDLAKMLVSEYEKALEESKAE